jgi:hypothetical protein
LSSPTLVVSASPACVLCELDSHRRTARVVRVTCTAHVAHRLCAPDNKPADYPYPLSFCRGLFEYEYEEVVGERQVSHPNTVGQSWYDVWVLNLARDTFSYSQIGLGGYLVNSKLYAAVLRQAPAVFSQNFPIRWVDTTGGHEIHKASLTIRITTMSESEVKTPHEHV